MKDEQNKLFGYPRSVPNTVSAILALILGIVGLFLALLAFLPCLGCVAIVPGLLCAILAIILGAVPDAPEDIVIGTSAFNLYPGEERHMIYPPFGPDAPDSGWTAYYWGRYPEVKGYQRFTMVTTGNPPPPPLDKRHRLPVMKNLRQIADIRRRLTGGRQGS